MTMRSSRKTSICALAALALGLVMPAERAAAQLPITARPPNALLEKTIRRGGKSGATFEEAPSAGTLLIGFVTHVGAKGGEPAIVGLQAIYLGPHGRQLGTLRGAASASPAIVEAKPGYAVGGLGLKAGSGILGLQIFFMRIAPNASELNPADFYVSDWLGSPNENVTYLANDGRLVLGFSGLAEKDLTALALIQASPASLDPPPVQIVATDDVTNYEKSWEEPGNKGTGFGPWIFSSTDASRTKAGFGLGDSTTNGGEPPSGGIDIAGKSWEMHARVGEEASAVRTFAHGPPSHRASKFLRRAGHGWRRDQGHRRFRAAKRHRHGPLLSFCTSADATTTPSAATARN